MRKDELQRGVEITESGVAKRLTKVASWSETLISDRLESAAS